MGCLESQGMGYRGAGTGHTGRDQLGTHPSRAVPFSFNPGAFPSRDMEEPLLMASCGCMNAAGGVSKMGPLESTASYGAGTDSPGCWHRAEKGQGQLEKVAFSFGTAELEKARLPPGSASLTHGN